MKTLSIFMLLFFGLSIQFVFAQVRQKISKETIIETSKFLEEKPLDKIALKRTREAMSWIHQNQGFRYDCSNGFQSIIPTSYKFRGRLIATYIISKAAYVIENSEQAKNDDIARNAGIISMLKAYEQIIKTKPKARLTRMEDLVNKQKNSVFLASLFTCLEF